LRGEDVEESDIDLFIISNVKKQMNMEKFEEFLKRKIHIIIEPDIKKINENLKSELINGEVLKGYLIYE
jgi:predicted nucleotidyltransferase